jgi:hypothetical protein
MIGGNPEPAVTIELDDRYPLWILLKGSIGCIDVGALLSHDVVKARDSTGEANGT